MGLNDKGMLPQFILTNKVFKELLYAEQKELDRLENYIATIRQATVSYIKNVVSDIAGNKCEIVEDIDNYNFTVYVNRENINAISKEEICEKLEELKPAHLSFVVAMRKTVVLGFNTLSCSNKIIKNYNNIYAGQYPYINMIGTKSTDTIDFSINKSSFKIKKDYVGQKPDINTLGKTNKDTMDFSVSKSSFKIKKDYAGQKPDINTLGEIINQNISPILKTKTYKIKEVYCGTSYCLGG